MTNYQLKVMLIGLMSSEMEQWNFSISEETQRFIISLIFNGTEGESKELSLLGSKCYLFFQLNQMVELRNFLLELVKLQKFFA